MNRPPSMYDGHRSIGLHRHWRTTKSRYLKPRSTIDVLVPLERGGEAELGGGIGEAVLLTEMIHNMIGHQQGAALRIGERCREGDADFVASIHETP